MNKFFNPITKKMEKLFETLIPVYTVCYENPLVGNKGESVYITLEAEDENDAKIKAMNNDEFTSYIQGKYFNRKYLKAYKPTDLYVIGQVKYYEGDPRL
jgi:hypothetical protein